MVAIGRALMSNPRVLLCDEISLGLAPVVIRDIYAAFPAIRAAGASVIVVEQDISQALKRRGPRLLHDGGAGDADRRAGRPDARGHPCGVFRGCGDEACLFGTLSVPPFFSPADLPRGRLAASAARSSWTLAKAKLWPWPAVPA